MEGVVIDFAPADDGSWHLGLALEFAKQRKGKTILAKFSTCRGMETYKDLTFWSVGCTAWG